MNTRARRALLLAAMSALALLSLAPLLWMLSVSFMAPGAASAVPPPLLPSAPTLENYRALFAKAGMGP